MTRTLIVDHHHDTDGNVYRLTFATVELVQQEDLELREVVTSTEEIVWASDDERWEGKDALAIAAEQRVIVSDLLRKRADDAAVRAEHAVETRTDLGGAGEEL